MKTSRLLTYAVFGIIAGLMFENKFLRVKQNVKDKRYAFKDKTNDIGLETRKLKKRFSKAMHR